MEYKFIKPYAKIDLRIGDFIDLNQYFYTNFEEAYSLSENNYTHDELVNMLNSEKIPVRQIAALKFDYIKTQEDANALMSNLTGVDGKIREAIAQSLYRLISQDINARNIFLSEEKYIKIFANATIDINSNICRLIVDTVNQFKSDENFALKYAFFIAQYAIEALDELDKFIFRDKKYVINKQLFKLYWCLEALKEFYSNIEQSKLFMILERSASQTEYTVREKVAQIIIHANILPNLQNELKKDENYYVRAAFELNH